MADHDVVLAKVAIIERCLRRIDGAVAGDTGRLSDLDVADITVLNLQRAAQAAIDLAAHVVASEGIGLPSTLAESFTMLERQGLLEAGLAAAMRSMVGFRNIAVHAYDALDPAIVAAIVDNHLDDLRAFAAWTLNRSTG